MCASTVPPLFFVDWQEHDGEKVSAPLSVSGTGMVVVFLSAQVRAGDQISARVEGRRKGGDWRRGPGQVVLRRVMMDRPVDEPIMHIAVNLKADTFDELRVAWKVLSGSPLAFNAFLRP